jgi:hypothetical protein
MIRLGVLSLRRGACRCRSIVEGEKAEGELELELVREWEVDEMERL